VQETKRPILGSYVVRVTEKASGPDAALNTVDGPIDVILRFEGSVRRYIEVKAESDTGSVKVAVPERGEPDQILTITCYAYKGE
jgi:DUF4097 and DUF4098 domain-containing protein YvlB